MTNEVDRTNWNWLEQGLNGEELGKRLHNIPSPYEGKETVPMCYPGTHLSKTVLGRTKTLLAKQLNAIGTHTHGKFNDDGSVESYPGEGGFEKVQRIEAQAIWMVASVLGGSAQETDGFFCGGGTESNLQGLWIGREWLFKKPDPFDRGTVVIGTPLSHYSVPKASDILGLDRHHGNAKNTGCGFQTVGMNSAGEMSVDLLRRMINMRYEEGFRRFLIVPTVGTSLMGSIDPVQEIGELITELRSSTANFYMHVDASFAGFTVPFVNPKLPIAFQVPEVMSVTVDGDKMGHLPYPGGIFLCRKNLQNLVKREVPYVRGNNDDTVPGSRSCLAPVCAWYLYQTIGRAGQREYVQKCLNLRDYLVQQMKEKIPWVKIKPNSPWVNFAPMEINFQRYRNGKSGIPDFVQDYPENEKHIPVRYGHLIGALAEYHLRSDKFPSDPTDTQSPPIHIYKLCVMPHMTKEHIDRFIFDLDRVDKLWIKAN